MEIAKVAFQEQYKILMEKILLGTKKVVLCDKNAAQFPYRQREDMRQQEMLGNKRCEATEV